MSVCGMAGRFDVAIDEARGLEASMWEKDVKLADMEKKLGAMRKYVAALEKFAGAAEVFNELLDNGVVMSDLRKEAGLCE